jgi:hypothetical protein
MMFSELAKVMDYAAQDDGYWNALRENVINKRTRVNQDKTQALLLQLYGFDPEQPAFRCFKYFWQQAETAEKPLLTLLYAISGDYLLAESIPVVLSTAVGEKVSVEKFRTNLDAHHPSRFSELSQEAIAQRLASSWKQAGYITGKVKSIRSQTGPGYRVVAFALLLSWLSGSRGNYILQSQWVKALDLRETQLRDLAFEASKRDLLQYQYSGAVTVISFNNLMEKLGIHGL